MSSIYEIKRGRKIIAAVCLGLSLTASLITRQYFSLYLAVIYTVIIQGHIEDRETNMSVSYTHLDVYKRQVLAIKNKSNAAVHLKRHEFKKAFDIYDPQDCKPSWMIYMMAVKKILRRLFR